MIASIAGSAAHGARSLRSGRWRGPVARVTVVLALALGTTAAWSQSAAADVPPTGTAAPGTSAPAESPGVWASWWKSLRGWTGWLPGMRAEAPAAPDAAPPAAPVARAQDASPRPRGEHLQVADAYLELHTGPGAAYPIFYVVEHDAWVDVEVQSTDWYRVRSAEGKVGWVSREQLAGTLTEGGERKTFREVVLGDYLQRRVEAGAAWGAMRSDPMEKIWMNVRLSPAFSLEGGLGQVQGAYAATHLWQAHLLVDPWNDLRVAPYFGIGLGKFINIPHASLVGAVSTNSRMTDATAGVRWHVSQRMTARLDYTSYAVDVSDKQIEEYRAWTAGLAFFF